MEDIRSIVDGILSTLIWIPISVLTAYLFFLIRVRLPHRRLWQVKDPSHLVISTSTSTTTNTGVYNRPATGIGQVRALILATQSLYKAYNKQLDIQNILLSKEPLNDSIENDMLVLGGPKNNEVAAKYLELLRDEQPIRIMGNVIIWRTDYQGGKWLDRGAEEYEGHVINRKVTLDYGFIVRSYNPFTSRKRVVVLFGGSHTYGTVVAAKFFSEDLHTHFRKLTRDGRKNFVVLISSQIVNGYPTKLKVERSYAW